MVSTRQSSNMGNSSSSGSVGEVGEVSPLKKHHSVTAGTSNSGSTIESRNLNLLDLPVEVLEKIFSYLGFNMVAHMRLVSSTFKYQCKHAIFYFSQSIYYSKHIVCDRFVINWTAFVVQSSTLRFKSCRLKC